MRRARAAGSPRSACWDCCPRRLPGPPRRSSPSPRLPSSRRLRRARGPVRVPLEDGVAVVLSDEKGITVEAAPRRGEGMAAFATRLCGDAGAASKVAEVNGGHTPAGGRPLLDPLRSPLAGVAAEGGPRPVRGRPRGGRRLAPQGARHRGRCSARACGTWPSGSPARGENFRAIREYNELHGRRRAARHGGDDPLRAAAPGLPRRPAGGREALPAPVRRATRTASTPSTACARTRRSTPRWWCASPAASSRWTSTASRRRSPSAAASRTSPTSRSASGSRSRSTSCSPSTSPRGIRSARSTRRACAGCPSGRYSGCRTSNGILTR